MTNDEGSYRFWRGEVEQARRDAESQPNVRQGIWNIERAACYLLSLAIQESFETFHPFRGEQLDEPRDPDVYGDLLDSALSEVRWSEIAEAFLEDL
jgi:hypothetical protein